MVSWWYIHVLPYLLFNKILTFFLNHGIVENNAYIIFIPVIIIVAHDDNHKPWILFSFLNVFYYTGQTWPFKWAANFGRLYLQWDQCCWNKQYHHSNGSSRYATLCFNFILVSSWLWFLMPTFNWLMLYIILFSFYPLIYSDLCELCWYS